MPNINLSMLMQRSDSRGQDIVLIKNMFRLDILTWTFKILRHASAKNNNQSRFIRFNLTSTEIIYHGSNNIKQINKTCKTRNLQNDSYATSKFKNIVEPAAPMNFSSCPRIAKTSDGNIGPFFSFPTAADNQLELWHFLHAKNTPINNKKLNYYLSEQHGIK